MIEPKTLVEKGICVSFGEARRLIFGLSEDRIKEMIQEKETAWGRKPRKSRLAWPNGNRAIETV